MRAVIQRVRGARVTVDGSVKGEIAAGAVILLGISRRDTSADADYLIEKIVNLRIFEDENAKMNLSLLESGGAVLIISQFTLYGDTRRGRRPSFVEAASGDSARPIYEYFLEKAREQLSQVESGVFGAMMDVELVNHGPVTLLLDSERNS